RAHDPVRLRRGRDDLRSHGRAVDRRHASMDARGLDVPRLRPDPRRALAYVEVGWGGYYAWDPVENAALMPWLAATAFLHSVMIQERKGMLKVWNMVLVALAFELSVFGTFLTRSGVVNSIHSFAKSTIGGWFLAFVVISSLFSVGLILHRLPLLRARTKLESALSREATFLYNNLLLVALCLTVLWGVLFPILTQLVKGETRTIGRPYYDF